jgi:hypothetical protein
MDEKGKRRKQGPNTYKNSMFKIQCSTLNCQLTTVNCQLSTVNSQLSTVNCQLSTVNCQLTTPNFYISIPPLFYGSTYSIKISVIPQAEIAVSPLPTVQDSYDEPYAADQEE